MNRLLITWGAHIRDIERQVSPRESFGKCGIQTVYSCDWYQGKKSVMIRFALANIRYVSRAKRSSEAATSWPGVTTSSERGALKRSIIIVLRDGLSWPVDEYFVLFYLTPLDNNDLTWPVEQIVRAYPLPFGRGDGQHVASQNRFGHLHLRAIVKTLQSQPWGLHGQD